MALIYAYTQGSLPFQDAVSDVNFTNWWRQFSLPTLFSLNAFSNLCVNQRIPPSYIYD